MAPVIAAAATMAGLARWVRAPAPWRPSKLRLDDDMQRSPGPTLSEFAAAQSEHADSFQENPASLKTLSSPNDSAARFTAVDPGTIIARTCSATLRPVTTAAASCRSLNRLFVQEPIKAQSIRTPINDCPGLRSMYRSARSMFLRRSLLDSMAGSGTSPPMGITSWGLVPQVTCGEIMAASQLTWASNTAEASDPSPDQYLTAWSQYSPVGANSRPETY